MEFVFNSDLPHQHKAIRSVTELFKGQPMAGATFTYQLSTKGQQSLFQGVANHLQLADQQLLQNLQSIQQANKLSIAQNLFEKHFSVEMETGTGKTYVYLRTIYELFKQYNFKKFVIVVPSVAIREGVHKTLQITQNHFKALYKNAPLHFQVYERKQVSYLRGFATSNHIEILVLNIDAFAKDANIINKPNDKLSGECPIHFIQNTHPIVIVDEPQNMESDLRKKAIQNLNPLCTLRYSATHKNHYNLLYRLDPVAAYHQGLVKQIEVDAIREDNTNTAFVEVKKIKSLKNKVTAKVIIHVNHKKGVKPKQITVTPGDNLYEKSNYRSVYQSGYIVEAINVTNATLTLSNGNCLATGEAQGGCTNDIYRYQIERTITEHLEKERKLNLKGIKVLSLFFIDKVANYRAYNEAGQPSPGKFAKWFDEIYQEKIELRKFASLRKYPLKEAHNGYFSIDTKTKQWKDTKETKAATNSREAVDTFKLIMQDKEALLSLDNPLRFIFSHSALREGWDNPNVFQICTLNETQSTLKKRQEIGRGLRLAVDQTGNRIYDPEINRLTIIANESYDDFANTLQQEIEEECGVSFQGKIKNKKHRKTITYRKGFENDDLFAQIWEKINHKTTYKVNYQRDELISEAAAAICALPKVTPPVIHADKAELKLTEEGIATTQVSARAQTYGTYPWHIPDVLGYIQSKTALTRQTIFDILKKSHRTADIFTNPQVFLDSIINIIQHTLQTSMIAGIKYKKVGKNAYDVILSADVLEVYEEATYPLKDKQKTIYEAYVPVDSGIEKDFARDCDNSEQIKFYFKLPRWFTIPTPIGSYNPDWAIVFEDEKEVYFIAETKGTGKGSIEEHKLRLQEQQKIQCGEAHFDLFEDVSYQVVEKVSELSPNNKMGKR